MKTIFIEVEHNKENFLVGMVYRPPNSTGPMFFFLIFDNSAKMYSINAKDQVLSWEI